MYTKISINLLEEEKFDHLQINDRTRVLHRSYYWVYYVAEPRLICTPETSEFVFNPSILKFYSYIYSLKLLIQETA